MASLQAVRTALANQITANTLPSLTAVPNARGAINLPVAVVMPAKTIAKYGTTLGATPVMGQTATLSATDFNLDIIVLISQAAPVQNVQQALDLWLGFEADATAVSIPAALSLDPTLGGVVDWCVPTTTDNYGPIEWNATTFFGARIHCSLSLV